MKFIPVLLVLATLSNGVSADSAPIICEGLQTETNETVTLTVVAGRGAIIKVADKGTSSEGEETVVPDLYCEYHDKDILCANSGPYMVYSYLYLDSQKLLVRASIALPHIQTFNSAMYVVEDFTCRN